VVLCEGSKANQTKNHQKEDESEQHWNYPIHYHFEQCQPFFEAVKEMIYKSDAKDYECEIMYGRKCRL
jgi:hypothetical protein